MANIFWNSYSINNFFNASLNRGNSTFGNFYSNLGDAAMIKSGTYKKLMKSYFNEAKSDSSSKSTSSSDSSSKKTDSYTYDKDGNKVRNSRKSTVLDQLLDHKTPYVSKCKNPYLDKILEKYDKKTTTADGTVTDKTESSKNDTATSGTNTSENKTQVSEATAGAVVDASV